MRSTRRTRARPGRGRLAGVLTACALAAASPAAGGDGSHSSNVELLRQVPFEVDRGVPAEGSDLAFQGDVLVAGSFQGVGFFDVLERRPYLRQRSFFLCPGAQGDVSIWGDLVFVSKQLDNAPFQGEAGCDSTDGSAGKQGLRILDVSDVDHPRQVKFVETECGSHTHTLVPHGKELIVYVSALALESAGCDRNGANGVHVVRVPLADPSKAELVSTFDVGPGEGCHDVTVFPARDLAAAACATYTQLWDVRDPLAPRILSQIVNPSMLIHHSTSITWDGKVMALADENFAGCNGTDAGAVWFYGIEDPTDPRQLGRFVLPRRSDVPWPLTQCWAHNFNVVPTRDGSYIAAVSFYDGGLSVIDFSDPANPVEAGHDAPPGADQWSAYWYNGRIYTNDWLSDRGIGVYEMEGLGPRETHSFRRRLNPQLQIADW